MNKLELSSYDPSWLARFEAERERVVRALGYLTEGGIIFSAVEHIGGTAVPGLAAKPCIDIALDAAMPLSEETLEKLATLGYAPFDEPSIEAQIFVRLDPEASKLYFVDSSASPFWSGSLTMRDSLRTHADFRQRFEDLKYRLAAEPLAIYEEGKAAFFAQHAEPALKGYVITTGFAPLERLQQELANLDVPWFVSSGWALDLFLGEPTRFHQDLDITLFYEVAPELQSYLHARGWLFHRMVDGVYKQWQVGEGLSPPDHQVHARRGDEFLDILFSRQEDSHWIYRRDETITLPLACVPHSYQGIPYLAPEAVLLYKSFTRNVGPRPKDQADFERVAPHLSLEAKTWLKQAVAKTNSEHLWLQQLD